MGNILKLLNKIQEFFFPKRIYGYAIEHRDLTIRQVYWEHHYNYKVYKTKKIAEEALSYIDQWKNCEYRIITLYTL